MNLNINNKDIHYQDSDVCILNPNCKKGIIIFSIYGDFNPLTGIKCGEQLKIDNIDFNRSIYHPYIFFRAPFHYNNYDYSSIETEINCLYDNLQAITNIIFIRVDPRKTYVYSSEIRCYNNELIYESRKTILEYFNILNYNNKYQVPIGYKPIYNLYSSKIIGYTSWEKHINYPNNDIPINRNSEILVRIRPLLPFKYLVKCLYNGIEIIKN